MRILDFEVSRFKNLRDFKISFHNDAPVSVVVGRNGSGKSNLLEALTIIFRDLDIGKVPAFPFRLRYEVRGLEIYLVSSSANGRIALRCYVDGTSIPSSRFLGSEGAGYRPDHVFGYYSGPGNRLESHFSAHQDRFYRDLIKGVDKPLRRLFYARNIHSNFVLLAFFLSEDADVGQLLTEHLGIASLDSVLFEMQQPPWSSRGGDSRFWNADGTVRKLLDRLYARSLAPMRLDVPVRAPHARSSKYVERLYLYLKDLGAVRDIYAQYGSPGEFFKALESTYLSDLIFDVRIRVKSSRTEEALTFRELSEGEQQLLLVLGLMRFTREGESLFLLDEPDTHLNPAWSVQYRRFLSDYGGVDEGCHVLMATHDPLVVAGLLRGEVRIMDRETDGRIVAVEPRVDPRGMGVGALLTSDIYGLRSQLDLETLDLLDHRRKLAARAPSSLSADEAERLRNLSMQLSDLGLLMEERDPEFGEYLRAKADLEREEPIVFTRQELEENRALARELLSEVLEVDAEERRDSH